MCGGCNPRCFNFDSDPPVTPKTTVMLMAATVLGLKRDGKITAAAEVERMGKIVYGDKAFKDAMAKDEGDGIKRRIYHNDGEDGAGASPY